MKRIVKRMLYVVAIVYVGSMVMLVLLENSIVYPVPGGEFQRQIKRAESVDFESADGMALHGWFLNRPDAAHTIVYFHGNGEDINRAWPRIEYLAHRLNASIFLFDYRGYGNSEGKPGEAGLVADGQAAVEWTSQRTGLAVSELILIGRSIGGGVACQVAAGQPPKALVLISAFSSMVNVAAEKYPVFPVRWLMRNRYDNIGALANFSAPLLQIHGQQDRIVPCQNGRRLFDSVPCENRRFLVIDDRGHNDLGVDDFVDELVVFLETL